MTTVVRFARIDAIWFTEKQTYWLSQLNNKETHRYTSMKSKQKQQQMLLSRALIAQALTNFNCSLDSAYNIINYSSLALPNRAQNFSISITHSGMMAAIILSDQPVKLGIDIEQIKKRNYIELTSEICTLNELTLIHSRKSIAEDFYQLWTVKESLAKASQCSLIDLYRCDCSAALNNHLGIINWQGIDYTFNHLNIQGYKGTITTNK